MSAFKSERTTVWTRIQTEFLNRKCTPMDANDGTRWIPILNSRAFPVAPDSEEVPSRDPLSPLGRGEREIKSSRGQTNTV